jgi:hypothetical protein
MNAYLRTAFATQSLQPVLAGNHLRRVMRSYALYYTEARTHRSLDKDSPGPRPIQRIGRIASRALVGGLHHQYVRI